MKVLKASWVSSWSRSCQSGQRPSHEHSARPGAERKERRVSRGSCPDLETVPTWEEELAAADGIWQIHDIRAKAQHQELLPRRSASSATPSTEGRTVRRCSLFCPSAQQALRQAAAPRLAKFWTECSPARDQMFLEKARLGGSWRERMCIPAEREGSQEVEGR